MTLRDRIAQRMSELVTDQASPWERVPSRYGDTIRLAMRDARKAARSAR